MSERKRPSSSPRGGKLIDSGEMGGNGPAAGAPGAAAVEREHVDSPPEPLGSRPVSARPMTPRPPRAAEAEPAETCLLRALRARTPEERESFATRGLSRVDDDPELAALLLRQLYLVKLDRLEYGEALRLADEMIELGELGDIARQDAARAAMGVGALDVAAGHLRIAARICPPDRRAFHLATLGALLRFAGKPREAIDAFSRASRWATKDRLLYRAQLVLCEAAAQMAPSVDMEQLRALLESSPEQKGYKLWVLGELCALLGDHPASRRYLTSFLSRTQASSPAKNLALRGEIARAEALLQQISA